MSDKCKKSHFGNCGPDVEGEYCLFHKPKKNKEEAKKFYELLEERSEALESSENINKVFRDDLDFTGYIFPSPYGSSIFRNAKFEGEVDFLLVDFKDAVDFSFSEFKENVTFEEANFGNFTNFEFTTFNKSVNFQGAVFESVAYFKDTIFRFDVNFENVNFQGTVYLKKPHYKLHRTGERLYRLLKNIHEREGRKIAADKIFVEEMRERRKQKTLLRRFLEWLVADLSCKYGTSWERVLGVSALILFGYSIVYWLVSSLTGAAIVFQNGETISSLTLPNLWNSIHYSAVTFTTLGYGNMFPQGFLEFVSDLEAITGAILMALLVAVFARKWMR